MQQLCHLSSGKLPPRVLNTLSHMLKGRGSWGHSTCAAATQGGEWVRLLQCLLAWSQIRVPTCMKLMCLAVQAQELPLEVEQQGWARKAVQVWGCHGPALLFGGAQPFWLQMSAHAALPPHVS